MTKKILLIFSVISIIATSIYLLPAITSDEDSNICSSYEECLSLSKLGNTEAQIALAFEYLSKGGFSKRDTQKAAYWFLTAAKNEDLDAQFYIGDLYKTGTGVSKNLIQAYAWLDIAEKRGHNLAHDEKEDVINELSEKQLEQAKKVAAYYSKQFKTHHHTYPPLITEKNTKELDIEPVKNPPEIDYDPDNQILFISTKPQENEKNPLVSISINNSVLTQEVLSELATSLEYTYEIDENILGSIAITAKKQPAHAVIYEICKRADLNCSIKEKHLTVSIYDHD